MVHSMRALRASPLLLLNTMEVFIKEPSLDWKVLCVCVCGWVGVGVRVGVRVGVGVGVGV